MGNKQQVSGRFVQRVALFACIAGILITVGGCGGGSASSQVVTAKTLSSIAISPANVSVVAGSNQQFTATGTYSDGSTQDLTKSVTWSSSTTGVATVSTSGLATAVAPGQTSISSGMNSVTASPANLTVVATGSLGSATATSIDCPSSPIGGICYQVAISCPNINNFNGYVKVTSPASTPVGTVVFSTGGNGTALYESFNNGPMTLNAVLQGGFTLAQISWGEPFTANQPEGWQTGPGGIRAVACRYATLAQWIYNNIHLASTSAPFCATGNSGGAELIGEALTHYGMGSGAVPGLAHFAMVEPTSGPPFARQDWACDCLSSNGVATDPCGRTTNFCVSLSDAQKFVDPAYAPDIPNACSSEVQNHTTQYDSIFLNDGVVGPPDSVLNYPNTVVNFLYGTLDDTTAPNQGHLWASQIQSTVHESCVTTAAHNLPDDFAGAQQVATDILNLCKLK
jgi:Big-like domain-containing protein